MARTGASSFSVPGHAVRALLECGANTLEIVVYLVLSCFSDRTGMFSTAGVTAVVNRTGCNFYTIQRAIQRLAAIMVPRTFGDPVPLLIPAEEWSRMGNALPKKNLQYPVRFVLPCFGQDAAERVWFSSSLVDGVGQFEPLRNLLDEPDCVAQTLLWLHLMADPSRWFGVSPTLGSWVQYVDAYRGYPSLTPLPDGYQLLRARRNSVIVSQLPPNLKLKAVRGALRALVANGYVYEAVVVIDKVPLLLPTSESGPRHRKKRTPLFPPDACPMYTLDSRTRHGPPPAGEEGVAIQTARLAYAFGYGVTYPDGKFRNTYAAFLPDGENGAIVGVWRLRFRVTNPNNAYAASAWAGLQEQRNFGIELINEVRHRYPDIARDIRDFQPKPAASIDDSQNTPTNRARRTTRRKWTPNPASSKSQVSNDHAS